MILTKYVYIIKVLHNMKQNSLVEDLKWRKHRL